MRIIRSELGESVRPQLNTDPAGKQNCPLRDPPLGQVQNSQRTLRHVAPKAPHATDLYAK
ncbi:hypothetical protein [Baia soyae]|uniref:hypothetical protein n=1 Tax=Baia soyae TaxID=1544746 RepID=UPI001046A662|nr:hypothetical protein [Baia soyae]